MLGKIGLIPSHNESPNILQVISQHRTTIYWNHIVPDGQESQFNHLEYGSTDTDRNWPLYRIYNDVLLCWTVVMLSFEPCQLVLSASMQRQHHLHCSQMTLLAFDTLEYPSETWIASHVNQIVWLTWQRITCVMAYGMREQAKVE